MTVRRRSSIVKQLCEETEGATEQVSKSPGFKARDSIVKNAISRDLSMANLKRTTSPAIYKRPISENPVRRQRVTFGKALRYVYFRFLFFSVFFSGQTNQICLKSRSLWLPTATIDPDSKGDHADTLRV